MARSSSASVRASADRTRLVLGYLLIWQGEYEEFGQTYRFSEAHYLQSGALADREEISLSNFLGTLRAAWKTTPVEGYAPLFMCSRHSKKLTSFLTHFRRMSDELDRE